MRLWSFALIACVAMGSAAAQEPARTTTAPSDAVIMAKVEELLRLERERILSELRALLAGRSGASTLPASAPRAPAGFLGIAGQAGEDGIAVTNVIPGTPAALLGLVAGDVIASVDGQAVKTLPAMLAMFRERGAGGRVVLEVRRTAGVTRLTTFLANRSAFDDDDDDDDHGEDEDEDDDDHDDGDED